MSNYTVKSEKQVNGKIYTFRRYTDLQHFVCEKCGKEKASKNVVYSNNRIKLCNGCYGELLK